MLCPARVAVGLTLLLCSVPALAQSNIAFGALSGTVTDPSGGVIQSVTVTAALSSTGASWVTESDNSGTYRFLALTPGDYELRLEKDSFQTAIVKNVRVTVGEQASMDQSLKVGSSREVIVVEENAELIEHERSAIATTLQKEAITSLPINRRDYLTFALLAPGVVDSTALADNADFRAKQSPTSGLSFNGSNGRGNSVTLDGGEMDDTGGGVRSTVSQEAVREFQINRGNYSAELGRASGGVVNIVTKSGANRPEGTVFGFFRDDVFDAANPFARVLNSSGALVRTKPPSHREQFGGSFGGPIAKNRTFFFGAAEGLIRNESSVVNLLTDSSVFDLTPTQKAILSQLPASVAGPLQAALTPTQRTISLFQNNTGVFPYTTHNWLFSTRLDHRLSDNDPLFFRFNYGNLHETNANLQAQVAASRGTRIAQFDPTILSAWTHIFGPRALNEAQLQFNFRSFDVSNLDTIGPEIRIQGYGIFNRDRLLPSHVLERRIQFRDGLAYIAGKHTLKAGFETLLRGVHTESDIFFGGRFDFGSLPGAVLNPALPAAFTITALQAFNLGLPQTYLQGFGDGTVASLNPYYAVYAQDSWQAHPDLVVNAGIRYEVDTRNPPMPNDLNNVAPRLAAAWRPFGDKHTVVRAGYGIFYSPIYYQIDYIGKALGLDANGDRQIAQTFTTIQTPGPAAANNVYATLLRQGVIGVPAPIRSIQPSDLTQFGLTYSRTGPLPPFSVVFSNAANFVNPYSQQTNFAIERELSSNLAVSASFTWVRTLKLTRSRDINLKPAPVDPALGIPVWTNPAYFVNPLLAQWNQYESSGKASYSSLILEVRKRLSHSFSMEANYTLSHAIDDITDYNTDYQASVQTDLRNEKGLSSFDQRHKLVLWGLWNAPGRVQVAPIFRANSARPFNLIAGFDLNSDRHDTTDRPAFAGRNTGIGPDFWTLDLRVARTFRMTERAQVELMAEGFNLMNRLNYGTVNNIVGNMPGPFNVQGNSNLNPSQPLAFTSALEGRRIQLGVRVRF